MGMSGEWMGMSGELNIQTIGRPSTEHLTSTEQEIGVQSIYQRKNEKPC
jgi:hypothetical protein